MFAAENAKKLDTHDNSSLKRKLEEVDSISDRSQNKHKDKERSSESRSKDHKKSLRSSNCYLCMSSSGSVNEEDSELQAEMCWLHLHVEKNDDRDYD